MRKKYISIEGKIPDAILRIAKAARRWICKISDGNPAGYCWDASSHLVGLLRRHGIGARVISGRFRTNALGLSRQGHAYVMIGKYILDVTADQFNEQLKYHQMRAIVWGTKVQLRGLYLYRRR